MFRLIQATGEGEVTWNEGAEDAFFANEKDAELHMRYIFDPDTAESTYQFRIVRGRNDAFFNVMSEEDDFQFMRNLYSAISVNAAGGEDLVEGLLD